jgi:hypothetical protein
MSTERSRVTTAEIAADLPGAAWVVISLIACLFFGQWALAGKVLLATLAAIVAWRIATGLPMPGFIRVAIAQAWGWLAATIVRSTPAWETPLAAMLAATAAMTPPLYVGRFFRWRSDVGMLTVLWPLAAAAAFTVGLFYSHADKLLNNGSLWGLLAALNFLTCLVSNVAGDRVLREVAARRSVAIVEYEAFWERHVDGADFLAGLRSETGRRTVFAYLAGTMKHFGQRNRLNEPQIGALIRDYIFHRPMLGLEIVDAEVVLVALEQHHKPWIDACAAGERAAQENDGSSRLIHLLSALGASSSH